MYDLIKSKLLHPALTTFAFGLLTTSHAIAAAPQCVDVGTAFEGWQMAQGKVLLDKCEEKVTYCGAIGTRSEGWYAALIAERQPIYFANCSNDQSARPKCVNQGTRSEGWETKDGKLIWDNCSEKLMICAAIGTRSEGWYSATIDSSTSMLLTWETCSAQ